MKGIAIAKFLKKSNLKRFEKYAEPQAIAYETFLKKSQIQTTFWYFEKIYNSIVRGNTSTKIRMCSVSDLRYGVHFSFKKKGKIFVAGHRFVRPGKSEHEMSLHYFGISKKRYFHGHIKYKLSKARTRLVYLHDINNRASAVVSEIKVIYK